MANFKTTIITQKGHALIAKLEAGTATSNFKKICTSDYDYSSLSNSQLEELTSIRDTKQTILPDKISVINKATVKVSGTLTNTELKTGYYIRTIALYAVDPDEGEILYSITPSTLSDFIPPNNGVTSSGVIIDLLTTVSNAENVSIDVDPNAIVSIQTFNDFKDDVTSQLNDIVPNTTLFHLDRIENIDVNKIIVTQGFYCIDEDADWKYTVKNVDGTEVWTDFNTFKISNNLEIIKNSNNTKKLCPIIENDITPEMVGGKGDGITDDTIIIQLIINFISSHKNNNLKLNNKTYLTSSPLILCDHLFMVGNIINNEYYNKAIIKNITTDIFAKKTKTIYGTNITGVQFVGNGLNNVFNTNNFYWGHISKCGFTNFNEIFSKTAFVGMKFSDSYINDVVTCGTLTGSDNIIENTFIAGKQDDTRPDFQLILRELMLSNFRNVYFTGSLTQGKGVKNILCIENNSRGNNFTNCWFDYVDYSLVTIRLGQADDGSDGGYPRYNSFNENMFRGGCRESDSNSKFGFVTFMGGSSTIFSKNSFLTPHIGNPTGNEKLFAFNAYNNRKTIGIQLDCNSYELPFNVYRPSNESDNIYINEPSLMKYPNFMGNYSNIGLDGENPGITYYINGTNNGQLYYNSTFKSFVLEDSNNGGLRLRGDLIPLDSTKSLGGTSTRWKDLYLVNAPTVSSKRELKTNIKLFDNETAYEHIKKLNIYTYNFIEFDSYGNKVYNADGTLKYNAENMLGSIYDELPIECINENSEGVDLYAYSSYAISALKVAIEKIERLELKIEDLENKILNDTI